MSTIITSVVIDGAGVRAGQMIEEGGMAIPVHPPAAM